MSPLDLSSSGAMPSRPKSFVCTWRLSFSCGSITQAHAQTVDQNVLSMAKLPVVRIKPRCGAFVRAF